MPAAKRLNIKVRTSKFLILALLACTLSCNDDPPIKKRLKLEYPKNVLVAGDAINVKIGNEIKKIDSIKVSGAELLNFNASDNSFKIKMNYVGRHNISVLAYENGSSIGGNFNLKVVGKSNPKRLDYEIVETINHDPEVYTQGYEVNRGNLYESGGQYNQSSVRRYDKPGGKLLKAVPLPPKYFGEGLTVMNDTVYQLTWKSRKCYRYYSDLSLIDIRDLPTVEGWGLCNDGENLMVSDGSHNIYKMDKSLNVLGAMQVYAGQIPLSRINELEFINSQIFANVYTTDDIYIIDPNSGEALAYFNLSELRSELSNPKAEVLNGIAYLPDEDLLVVTGKYWDKAFKIRVSFE